MAKRERSNLPLTALLATALAAAGCGREEKLIAPPGARPLLEGLSEHHMAITTSSPLAQRYF
ncbi:MAG TPA: hypothetical protein VEI82_15560, partial [Myxococcota bacterium]|nr:hypothetical protein [Myxococcota bacterium]